jgi:heme/copper-type cytochrome/quinol oxidase subunit 2
MQVTSKHQSMQTMVSTEKQQEYEQILKRVQEMKHREDMQRQIR